MELFLLKEKLGVGGKGKPWGSECPFTICTRLARKKQQFAHLSEEIVLIGKIIC